MIDYVSKHPRAIRWFHWVNFPLLFLMIWSGILIYWANDVYIRFPDWFYNAFNLHHRLAEGMAFHFFFMWFFAINGIAYVLYTIFSGEWRELVPNRHALKDAMLVTLHDLHIIKSAPPHGKFNAAQKIAYTGIVLMGSCSLITGLAIYRSVQFGWLTNALGGYEWARFEHFLLTMGYVFFFMLHIAQVVRAGWNNFQAMVTGYERK